MLHFPQNNTSAGLFSAKLRQVPVERLAGFAAELAKAEGGK